MSGGNPIILITGQPGVGKTTLIKRLAEKAGERAGGFYTQEIRQGGVRKGFEIVTLDGESAYLSRKSPQKIFEREIVFKSYRVNLSGIEKVAVPALLKTRDEGKIVFVDEIGPMEISSRTFCETIRRLLDDGTVTLVGTIVKRPYRFADEVKRHARVRMVELTHKNREGMEKEIWGELQT